MELGIGIHGEPGTERKPIQTADVIVDYLMERILKDMNPQAGDEVAVMINGSGATPPMELYILNRRVHQILAAKGIKVFKTFVGDYMTSIDMAGASITLLKLDDEIKDLLVAKADTIGFKM
jgi:dihydroxyacetone kinase-like protein